MASEFTGTPPKIATRCAVFAKTDLIHCQQQGYSIEAISAGLCEGLAHNIIDTLFKGSKIKGPVVAVGGVSKNTKVIHYISETIGIPIEISKHAEITGVLGCALQALEQSKEVSDHIDYNLKSILKEQHNERYFFFPPLITKSTTYPDFEDHDRYINGEVEVDVYNLPKKKSKVRAYLGIDIGSTSTKAILMSARGKSENILIGLYTRTKGDPIRATQKLFRALNDVGDKYQITFKIIGVGTTGSGRKFIKKVINANLAVDEITAHAKAEIH